MINYAVMYTAVIGKLTPLCVTVMYNLYVTAPSSVSKGLLPLILRTVSSQKYSSLFNKFHNHRSEKGVYFSYSEYFLSVYSLLFNNINNH